MLITDMLTWWYGPGWLHVIQSAKDSARKLYYSLSVKQMLRTLFAPWKEDRVEGGQGLDQMMQAMVMNLVARLIGFTIRIIFIFAWLAGTALLILTAGSLVILWPIFPLLPFVAIALGIASL